MNGVEILTPGEKIRKLRKQLKIRQSDITGGEITRNLISIIENDKANLTDNVANILVNNINEICEQRDLGTYVDKEYLLESVESQITKHISYLIESIKSFNGKYEDFNKFVSKIRKFIARYDISYRSFKLYKEIGDKYSEYNNKINAYEYYSKAFDALNYCSNSEEKVEFILKAAKISTALEKHQEALYILEVGKELCEEDSIDVTYMVLIKLKLCEVYKNNEMYTECTDLSKFLLKKRANYLTCSERVSLIILNGIVALKTGNMRLTLLEYRRALRIAETPEERQYIYSKLLSAYIIKSDKVDLIKTINTMQACEEEGLKLTNKSQAIEIYLTLADALINVNREHEGQKYYLLALEEAKNLEDDVAIDLIVSKMIESLDICENHKILTAIKVTVVDLISKDKVTIGSNMLYSLMRYYNKNNYKGDLSQLLSLVM